MTQGEDTLRAAEPPWKRKRFYKLGAVFFGPVVAALIGVLAISGSGKKAPDQGGGRATNVSQSMVANQQVIIQVPPTATSSSGATNSSEPSLGEDPSQVQAHVASRRDNTKIGSGHGHTSTLDKQVKPAGPPPVQHASAPSPSSVQTQGPCSPVIIGSQIGNMSAECKQ